MTIDIMTSVAESIPSPNTAKLPDTNPMTILATDNTVLPIVLIHDVLISILSLETKVSIFERIGDGSE
jgi:hypothetical protein